MAKVFVSYAREDKAQARVLANALRKDGHDVWWDDRIHGGSTFSGAIEQALNEAEAVLVLWSRHSIASSWVCDEATEGRDRGVLVPVQLDDSRPPIGFRQIQCLDCTNLKSRPTRRQIEQISSAIAEKGQKPERDPGERERQPSAPSPRPRWAVAAAVLVAVAVLATSAAAMLFWFPTTKTASEPIVAVIPFEDLSPGHDKAYIAQGVGDAILTILARNPGISVIGRTSAAEFSGRRDDLATMRRALGVTHVLEGSSQAIGSQLRMSVRLVDVSSGKEVWAEEYRRPITNIFAVQDEIGHAVASALKGKLSTTVPVNAREQTQVGIYNLYLAARAESRDRNRDSLEHAFELAKRVIAADPTFAPGHALYADLVTLLADTSYGHIPAETALSVATAHAKQAIQLAPDSADGYAALGAAWAQVDGSRAIAPLRKALQLDPSKVESRLWLGAAENDVGRNSEAAEDYRKAFAMDPLLRPAVWRLVVVYAASGEANKARDVISEYRVRGGSSAWADFLESEISTYRGDLADSVRQLIPLVAQLREYRLASWRLAWAYRDLGLYDAAKPLVQSEDPLVQAIVLNKPEAVQLARDTQRGVWFGDDLEFAVETLADAHDWQALAKLYDDAGAIRSRACRLPFAGLRIAVALSHLGRGTDAKHLVSCVKASVESQEQGGFRTEFLPIGALHAAKAQLYSLAGDGGRAFAELQLAANDGYRVPAGWGLDFLPALDALRGQPEYQLLDRRYRELIVRERQKLQQQG